MKKIALLVFSTLLASIVVSCTKDETTSKDAGLTGVNVAVGEKNGKFDKLFVLNEGNFQKNNSTLDFFRFSDGNYISDAGRSILLLSKDLETRVTTSLSKTASYGS